MTVMVVDDSATMRKIVILALQPAGFQTVEAENGQDALDKSASQKADCFIVDVNMPVMNGIEFVKNLRTKPDYAKTPVIMLTTENEDKLINSGKAAGATGWVVKPFKNEDFLELVKKLVKPA